jgi:hypothetical protein
METSKLIIACPQCKHTFSPEAAMENDLRVKMNKEFEEKLISERLTLRKSLQEETEQEYRHKLTALESQANERNQKLVALEKQELEWKQKERSLKDREEQMELTLKRKMMEQEQSIRADAEKRAKDRAAIEFQEKEQAMVREKENLEMQLNTKNREEMQRMQTENDMKSRELLKKLEDQNKLVDELKKKAEQGSMQLQGEVQELALEEYLRLTFPFDEISEVGKGVNGADCIQIVKSPVGKVCGKIIYESKRTKHFGGDWTDKLKTDMRNAGCDIAVLVTEVFPKDVTRFGLYEGVWICSFAEMKSVSLILRSGLMRVGEAIASQENKGDKMQMLYDYLTGVEFRNYVETVVESLAAMKSNIEYEKKSFFKIWAEREKQVDKVVMSTLHMFGSVKGIAGSSFQDIPQLQLLENPVPSN